MQNSSKNENSFTTQKKYEKPTAPTTGLMKHLITQMLIQYFCINSKMYSPHKSHCHHRYGSGNHHKLDYYSHWGLSLSEHGPTDKYG